MAAVVKLKPRATEKGQTREIQIPAPRFAVIAVKLVGTAPLVTNRFSKKAQEIIKARQEAGSVGASKKKREPKDFAALYEESLHRSKQGWFGFPAGGFRQAAISACRTVDFKMTLAKLSLFILADGFEAQDGTALVKITKGKPHPVEHYVRNQTGVVDLRARAMFDEGWEMILRVRYDEDRFSRTDVVNLISRMGEQVGIGEGRTDSPGSAGMGWGSFTIGGKVSAIR